MGKAGDESYSSEMNWRVTGEWLPKWWAESLCQDAKAHFELIDWHLEEREKQKMMGGWEQLSLWNQSELDQL